jgi:hypothetical protein
MVTLIYEVQDELRCKTNTAKGYDVVTENDCLDLSFPTSTTRRGRVTKGKSPCLMESSNKLYSYKDGIVRTVNNFETTYEITELTEQEIQDYFESTKPPLPEPIPFDWDAYKQQVNETQEEWFLNIITADPYEYSSFYELSLWVNHPTYGNEAQVFIQLWWDSWDLLKQHLSTVTEETADIQTFINQLNDLYAN